MPMAASILFVCGQHDRREVLGGVADQRDDDHADEEVGHAEVARGRGHRRHQQLADDGDGGGGGEEHDHRPADFLSSCVRRHRRWPSA